MLRYLMVLTPFIWFGGIMALGTYLPDGKARSYSMLSWALGTPVLLVFVPMVLTADIPARYSPLVLYEGAFEWPAGCIPREYRDGEDISIACHNYRNVIPRKLIFDHGFYGTIGRPEQEYFRVGSEAINFSCNYFTQRCSVRHAEHDVFRDSSSQQGSGRG